MTLFYVIYRKNKVTFTSLFIAFALMHEAASAWTVTAVCSGLKGRAMGVSGSGDAHKKFDRPEGMNSKLTILVDSVKKSVQAVWIYDDGQPPFKEDVELVYGNKDQITMTVTYPAAVFMYSLFPKRRHLFLVKHTVTSGLDLDAARMLALQASCEVSYAD